MSWKERERLRNVKKWKLHVQSVQNYCFSSSNRQIYDVLVADVVVVAYVPYQRDWSDLGKKDIRVLHLKTLSANDLKKLTTTLVPSKNRKLLTVSCLCKYFRNSSTFNPALESTTGTATTTPAIKNLIGRVGKNKRAARAICTYEQVRVIHVKLPHLPFWWRLD